jgi:hypothetical protein
MKRVWPEKSQWDIKFGLLQEYKIKNDDWAVSELVLTIFEFASNSLSNFILFRVTSLTDTRLKMASFLEGGLFNSEI